MPIKITDEFWRDIKRWDTEYPNNFTIVKGSHYTIGDENSTSSRGFAGAKVRIKFFDGREVISTNLWHNGTIPEEYKELFEDNATLEWLH